MSGEMRREAAPGPAGRADGGAGPSSERRRPAERTGGARVLSSRGPAAEEPERGALQKAAGLRLRRAARPAQRGLRRGVPLYKLPAAADGGPHTPFRPSEYAKREKFVSFPCPVSAGRDARASPAGHAKKEGPSLLPGRGLQPALSAPRGFSTLVCKTSSPPQNFRAFCTAALHRFPLFHRFFHRFFRKPAAAFPRGGFPTAGFPATI